MGWRAKGITARADLENMDARTAYLVADALASRLPDLAPREALRRAGEDADARRTELLALAARNRAAKLRKGDR
jgi:hypothetical protein